MRRDHLFALLTKAIAVVGLFVVSAKQQIGDSPSAQIGVEVEQAGLRTEARHPPVRLGSLEQHAIPAGLLLLVGNRLTSRSDIGPPGRYQVQTLTIRPSTSRLMVLASLRAKLPFNTDGGGLCNNHPANRGGMTKIIEAVRQLLGRKPIFGVCLGHQSIAQAFGAEVVRGEPVHGKTARIMHDGRGVYRGLDQGFEATRYHSLLVTDPGAQLVVTARAEDLALFTEVVQGSRQFSSQVQDDRRTLGFYGQEQIALACASSSPAGIRGGTRFPHQRWPRTPNARRPTSCSVSPSTTASFPSPTAAAEHAIPSMRSCRKVPAGTAPPRHARTRIPPLTSSAPGAANLRRKRLPQCG